MVEGPKKFGAFSGVFTPSILTILGVIMYLRLGWVAGVSGLIGIIAIILLAHVISFTTGLSISSIATDKKIKAGGIYYILSRSLGLPMGGSIGITLFVGTALSISMYIVGFTESFLAIPTIAGWMEYLGLPLNDMNTVRIIGSAVLLLLVIIAFISTDVAIKTQFLILAAIALSLISVIVGLFVHPEFHPQTGLQDYQPFKDISFEVVFAVFFPAVTGFTAGVAMSGDLNDPKKDIPKGTMWAIIVGFVVYLLLGIGFVLFVNRDTLLHDYNFLMKLAWIPALVVAGIWGATLSSALGGILGGPRILQAIAKDRIVPKFFGKGFGVNNEPRNALVFTFLISEIGILIGDLNIIAGIVTMFYLTAYGFINLAFSLEKWASTDFRPSFKVPIWVGVIGFLSSFMLMFKLDMVSMFAALIILSGIYFYINRKSIRYRGTNVWQSVYISLVRNILVKLSKQELDERNWKANILLFSGGTKVRPHLIEFGKAIIANQGIVSNFELIENKNLDAFFGKNKLSKDDKEISIEQGIFTRHQECKDIYSGIEVVSAVYGFSGIEPNTVLLGWGRHSEQPERFVKMIKRITDLDMNIVLLDYDKKRGFGNKELIDVWWRGGSNNGNLMLALLKFIKSNFDWQNARVRIMIVNPVNNNRALIERDATQVLLNIRMEAEIRIINNEIEKRPIYDIIKQESINSDLIFLGIPEVQKNKEKDFIESVDRLCKDIGTTVLIKASSMFKELHIGMRPGEFLKKIDTDKEKSVVLPKLIKPVPVMAAIEIERVFDAVSNIVDSVFESDLHNVLAPWDNFLKNIKSIWQNYYTGLHTEIKTYDSDIRLFVIEQNLRLISEIKSEIKEFQKREFTRQKNYVEALVIKYKKVLNEIAAVIPEKVIIEFTSVDIKMLRAAKKLSVKEEKRLRKKKLYRIDFRKIKEEVILTGIAGAWLEMLVELDYRTFEIERKFNRLLNLIEEYQPGKYYSNVEYEKIFDVLQEKEKSFDKILRELRKTIAEAENTITDTFYGEIIRLFNKASMLLETPSSIKKWKKARITRDITKAKEKLINRFPAVWYENRQLITNITFASFYLLSFKLVLRAILIEGITEIRRLFQKFDNEFIIPFKNKLIDYLKQTEPFENGEIIKIDTVKSADYEEAINNFFIEKLKLITEYINDFPEKIVLFNDKKYNAYKEYEFSNEPVVEIKFSVLIKFIIENELLIPVKKTMDNIVSEYKYEISETEKFADEINKFVEQKNKNHTKLKENLSKINVEWQAFENEIKSNRENIELSISERINAVWDKLRISTLTIQNELLSSYIKGYKVNRKDNLLNMYSDKDGSK